MKCHCAVAVMALQSSSWRANASNRRNKIVTRVEQCEAVKARFASCEIDICEICESQSSPHKFSVVGENCRRHFRDFALTAIATSELDTSRLRLPSIVPTQHPKPISPPYSCPPPSESLTASRTASSSARTSPCDRAAKHQCPQQRTCLSKLGVGARNPACCRRLHARRCSAV